MRDMLSDGITRVGWWVVVDWVRGLEGRSQEGRASRKVHVAGGHSKVMLRCEVNYL